VIWWIWKAVKVLSDFSRACAISKKRGVVLLSPRLWITASEPKASETTPRNDIKKASHNVWLRQPNGAVRSPSALLPFKQDFISFPGITTQACLLGHTRKRRRGEQARGGTCPIKGHVISGTVPPHKRWHAKFEVIEKLRRGAIFRLTAHEPIKHVVSDWSSSALWMKS